MWWRDAAPVFSNLASLTLAETFRQNLPFPNLDDWLGYAIYFTTPLIPISFAYAIIRHQVIPVSLIIRRGVRYVLVSRGAILLDIIAVGLAFVISLFTLSSAAQAHGFGSRPE